MGLCSINAAVGLPSERALSLERTWRNGHAKGMAHDVIPRDARVTRSWSMREYRSAVRQSHGSPCSRIAELPYHPTCVPACWLVHSWIACDNSAEIHHQGLELSLSSTCKQIYWRSSASPCSWYRSLLDLARQTQLFTLSRQNRGNMWGLCQFCMLSH